MLAAPAPRRNPQILGFTDARSQTDAP
jgi:hypothetical protein